MLYVLVLLLDHVVGQLFSIVPEGSRIQLPVWASKSSLYLDHSLLVAEHVGWIVLYIVGGVLGILLFCCLCSCIMQVSRVFVEAHSGVIQENWPSRMFSAAERVAENVLIAKRHQRMFPVSVYNNVFETNTTPSGVDHKNEHS